MANHLEDLLRVIVRRLNPLRNNLTVLNKKLENIVKEFDIKSSDCERLSFPQLGDRRTREPTVEGILSDNAQRLCVLIFVADFVAKSLPHEQTDGDGMCGVLHGLYQLRNAINYVIHQCSFTIPAEPVVQLEDLEERVNDECRMWLKYVLRRESEEVCIACRNYVICQTLSLWVDALTTDLQYLAGLVTEAESFTYEELRESCCMTVTTVTEKANRVEQPL